MAEGRNIQIPFLGIVRNTPGALGRDGEMEDAVNLVYKDGALRVKGSRKVLLSGFDYSEVFIHDGPGYKHFLGATDGKLFYFADQVNETITVDPSPTELVEAEIVSLSFTGNVITVLTSAGVLYLIWYNGEYLVIPSSFDGAETDTMLGPVRIELKTEFKGDPSTGVRNLRQFYSDEFKVGADKWEGVRDSFVLPTMLKAVSVNQLDGYLQGFHLAITAVELFDGSYILHSSPVLIGQPNDRGTRYRDLHGTSYDSTVFLAWDFSSNPFLNVAGEHNSEFKFYEMNYAQGIPHPWNDVQKTPVDNFPYIVPYVPYYNDSGDYKAIVVTALGELKYRVTRAIDPELEPVVKSVSIFITPSVNQYKMTFLDEYIFNLGYAVSGTYTRQYRAGVRKDYEILEALLGLPFYKVADIPFSSLTTEGEWVTVDLKHKLGDSLLTQEVLPVDPMSHHTLNAMHQMVYNSKLHLLNYSQTLSRGFPLPYFYQVEGAGQFSLTGGFTVNTNYTAFVAVDIQTETGLSRVVRYVRDPVFAMSNLAPFLSYPDNRAVKMTIYRGYADLVEDEIVWKAQKLELALKKHPVHNFAYYASENLKPIPFVDFTAQEKIDVPGEINRLQVYENGLKVGQTYNPFTFPLETTYRVGSGRGVALASNSIPLSTGQFGEYPLLAFCSDGVYAMFVGGGEVTYSASRPLARDVCNNPRSVKTVDGGTVFSTDRGLMLISGDKVVEISESLEGDILNYTTVGSDDLIALFAQAINNDSLVRLAGSVTEETFLQYIASAVVGYNHYDREIWVTNPEKPYSYTYRDGRWGKMFVTGGSFVNDYPQDLLLTLDGELLSLGVGQNANVPVMLLTRPIKLGTLDFKQTYRAVIRGLITTAPGKYAGMYLFGSYDGIKWAFLGGSEMTGQIKDIGTTVERVDCKYFRIGFVGELTPDSALDYIEVSAKARLTGKLR